MFGWLRGKRQSEDGPLFLYLQTTKTRICFGAYGGEESLLLEGSNEERGALFYALCSYFCTRTDDELEMRGVRKDERDLIWSELLKVTFEEVGLDARKDDLQRVIVLKGMGLASAATHHAPSSEREVANYPSFVARLLRGMATIEDATCLPSERVAAMLGRWETSRRYLDQIAASCR